MATSADTLSTIIDTLAKKYNFDYDKAIDILSKKELLPKKMISKKIKDNSPWASKKAEELASTNGIVAEGNGSGKNGKWTLSDVEKAMNKPVKTKTLISPNALNFANENGISIIGKIGSGKDGRILLKDVEEWINNYQNDEDKELNISPRALQEANEASIKNKDLNTIHGSGVDGRILLKDIQKYISDSEKSSDDEDDDEDDEDHN